MLGPGAAMTLIISVSRPQSRRGLELLGRTPLPAQLWGFLRALAREEILSLLSERRSLWTLAALGFDSMEIWHKKHRLEI